MKLVVKTRTEQHIFSVEPGTPLSQAMADPGLSIVLPCAGRGSCGKCRIKASGALSPITPAERRFLSTDELNRGIRLLCQTVVLGDACVELADHDADIVVEGASSAKAGSQTSAQGYVAAVDIGTTTVAACLYAARDNGAAPVASAGRRNPQAAFGADVLSRMEQAQAGASRALRESILSCVDEILTELLRKEQIENTQLKEIVIAGNTVMLYLLTGADTICLSRAPFLPETLFGEVLNAGRLGLQAAPSSRVYLPRCASAFIGADCLCAMLACGMPDAEEPCAMIDLGTNGEIAVFTGSAFWCASTAAGPAFEGAGITMGMPAVPGAIDHVERKGFRIACTTIGGEPACGICGSGLVDAAAVLRQSGILDADGTIRREGHPFRAMVCEIDDAPAVRFAGTGVILTQADIRALQVAKAALGAGLQTLLSRAGLRPEQLKKLYIAGGFGRFLHLEHAAQIGLFPPALLGRAVTAGNAALRGAGLLAVRETQRERIADIARNIRTVSLGDDPDFEQAYLEGMCFPE